MRYVLSLSGLAALLVASQLIAQQTTTNPTTNDPAVRRDTGTPPATTDRDRNTATIDRDRNTSGTFRDQAKHQAELGQQKVVRASKVIGTNVKNKGNESLGEIKDVVFDPMDGRISYAAISMGGFLGIGDKLFAVPWDAIEFRDDNGTYVAFLDIDKQRMQNAQGFDKDHWPDMASQQWRTENDRPYQSSRRQQTHEVYKPVQPDTSQNNSQRPGNIRPLQPQNQPLPAQPQQQQ